MKKLSSAFLCLCLLAPGCVVAAGQVETATEGRFQSAGFFLVGCNPAGTQVSVGHTLLLNGLLLTPLSWVIGMPVWLGGIAIHDSIAGVSFSGHSYIDEVAGK